MRNLFLGLAAAVLLGCGGDKATAPQTGEVIFKIDALTCTGTSSILFFVDGSQVGQQTLSAGQSSSPFEVDAGPHALGAREAASGGYVWPTTNATVPANTSYTATLTC